MTPPRSSPYGAWDHALAPIFVVACLARLAGAGLAEAARHAAGAAMLAVWWWMHWPWVALGAVHGRKGR